MGAILRQFDNLLNPGLFQVPTGALKIDWTHPLSRNLIGCWVPGVMGPKDVTGQTPDLVRQSAAGVLDITAEGYGLRTAAASSGYLLTAPAVYKGTTGLTLYWRGYRIAAPTNDSIYLGITYDSVGNSPYLIANIGDSGGKVGGNFNCGGSWKPFQTTTVSSALDGTIASLGFTLPQTAGAADYLIYSNGLSIGTQSQAGSPISTATSNICLNSYDAAPTRNVNGICLIACIWNRVLSAEEMIWLSNDPYGFLIPAEYEMSALSISLDHYWQLYFSKNSGAYNPVTTTSVGVKSADASSDADGTTILIPRL